MADNTRLAREVGAKIKYLRQKHGLSQEALALTCDMNPAFLGHVERGMRSPTLNTLQRICDGLGITLTELLLTETDNNASNNSASIQHVVDIMQQLNPAQAKHMADLVDSVTLCSLTRTNLTILQRKALVPFLKPEPSSFYLRNL